MGNYSYGTSYVLFGIWYILGFIEGQPPEIFPACIRYFFVQACMEVCCFLPCLQHALHSGFFHSLDVLHHDKCQANIQHMYNIQMSI